MAVKHLFSGGMNMKFEDAINVMSGLLDMYYEEFYKSDIETEGYKELEKAEMTLYLLVK